VIVGRMEAENHALQAFQAKGDVLMYLKDHQGPMTLVHGRHDAADLQFAASITVRYGDVPDKGAAEVIVQRKGGIPYCMTADRAREEDYLQLRVAAS
jgi:hypothetical protein